MQLTFFGHKIFSFGVRIVDMTACVASGCKIEIWNAENSKSIKLNQFQSFVRPRFQDGYVRAEGLRQSRAGPGLLHDV